MKAYLNAMLIFTFLAASGFAVRFLFSDVVPIAEDEQVGGRVFGASIENPGWAGLALARLLGLGWLVSRDLQRQIR